MRGLACPNLLSADASQIDYYYNSDEPGRMHVAADYLSGGEQQMVAVARTLSGNLNLLLLDKPFEGLAPSVVLELFDVFDRLREHVSITIVETIMT